MPISMARMGNNEIVCIFDPVVFAHVILQTAANVIIQSKEMPIREEKPKEGAGGLLAIAMPWAAHGFQNSLQAQAEFLYEAIPLIISDPLLKNFLGRPGTGLIRDALTSYQEQKNALVSQIKVPVILKNLMDDFVLKDWTDRNVELIHAMDNI